MTQTIAYGHAELQAIYRYNMARAMIIAAGLMLAIGGLYQAIDAIRTTTATSAERTGIIIIDNWKDIPLPPPIGGTGGGAIIPELPGKFFSGIPVPVPDATVDPDQTIPTQVQMGQTDDPAQAGGQAGTYTGMIVIPQDEDPAPTTFIPYEQEPHPVLQTPPVYPDLARRAGLEGTVHLRILITKEGKVKQALIEKTDADIFNQAAIDAAMKWIFTPALMNKQPVTVWLGMPIKFRLRDTR